MDGWMRCKGSAGWMDQLAVLFAFQQHISYKGRVMGGVLL